MQFIPLALDSLLPATGKILRRENPAATWVVMTWTCRVLLLAGVPLARQAAHRHRRRPGRGARAAPADQRAPRKTCADLTMRVLRTVYNRGLHEHPDLPPNRCRNVDFHGTPLRRSRRACRSP